MDLQSGELLTVREAAQALRVCTATVYRLCDLGELPNLRILNALRIPRTALARYLDVERGKDS